MKGDFTRDTFKPDKHYQQVLMQQGRVQLDADWNEQTAIAARRDETFAADLVGDCGGPADSAAFAIIAEAADLASLPADPVAPIRQFALSAGRYYVDGIQCEADAPFLFSWQPDHREAEPLEAGNYLIYLDVWQRHMTVHEDGQIRESALGGPDTGTRVKTVWQVRAAALDVAFDPDNPPLDPCHQSASKFEDQQREALPRLAAKTTDATPETDPCTVPASAGYRGLENQLYRVEIHKPGGLNVATYKWSRENGAVVTRITNNVVVPVDGVNVNRLTVASTGLDDNLGFKKGNLVEVIHESEELEGIHGTLALIEDVDNATGIITLPEFGTDATPINIDLNSNPRLRRWEGSDVVAVNPAVSDGFLSLENGVEIKFDQPTGAEFRTGDFWQIPARSASPDAQSGKIEWPEIEIPSGKAPEFLPPKGIEHHYCRLGVVSVDANLAATVVSDCRCLWPSITDVPRIFYVSGDGQEVMPELTSPQTRFKLPRPLIVGVPNAHCHQDVRKVRFAVVDTAQSPSSGHVVAAGGAPTLNTADVPLDATGLASCDFYLDRVHYSQQVEARLLDQLDQPVSTPIRFNANLSRASEVSYEPGKCGGLAGQVTVQTAIDRLARQVSLHKIGGDAQEGAVGQPLPKLIEVRVANRCGPVGEVEVQFSVRAGGGSASPAQPVTTDGQGQAACKWILGNSTATQELEAVIVDNANPIAAPASVLFTAKIPTADTSEPGLHIKDVRLGGPNPGPLQLGMILPLGALASELFIVCDGDVDPATVNDGGTFNGQQVRREEPTCFVKVEIPIPLSRDEINFWGDNMEPVGYTPIVMAADVKADNNQIVWKLSKRGLAGLRTVLGNLSQFNGSMGDRLLARLTLKGNFIWALRGANDRDRLYLDGESFRLPPGNNAHDLQLPSGDKRRGGDFEMWFWIKRD